MAEEVGSLTVAGVEQEQDVVEKYFKVVVAVLVEADDGAAADDDGDVAILVSRSRRLDRDEIMINPGN